MSAYSQVDAKACSPLALQRDTEFCTALLAMVGHDLRQPLQILAGSLSCLAQYRTKPREARWIHNSELAIARLVGHLDMLVDTIRMFEDTGAVVLAEVPVQPILSALCHETAEAAQRKGLTVRLHTTDAAVVSHRALLEGILRNLLNNALKYTPPGGQILAGCRRRGSTVRIEVYDTGVGIPAEKFGNIFEAFQRVDPKASEGLGLGLFIVKHAAHLLGHRIEIRSTIGRGTRFALLARTPERGEDASDRSS